MKITKQLRSSSPEDLRTRLEEFKKELSKLNVQVATGAAASSSGKLKQTKKNIARVLTLLKEKEVKSA